MRSLKRAVQGIAVACGLMLGVGALAANSGTVVVSAQMGATVEISGLSDITFTGVDPAAGASPESASGICVRSNAIDTGYHYNVTVSSSTSAFSLAGPSTLGFTATWDDGGASPQALSEGIPLTGRVADSESNCPNRTATLEITLNPGDVAAAAAGNYSATLTVTVAPE